MNDAKEHTHTHAWFQYDLNNWIFGTVNANENFLTIILPTAFCLGNYFSISLSSRRSSVPTLWLFFFWPAYVYCFRYIVYTSARHYHDNLSLYFIVISFSLSFIAIKKTLSLSIYRYRDTFVSKSAIIDNKIQQLKNNFTHDACLPSNNFTCFLSLNNEIMTLSVT